MRVPLTRIGLLLVIGAVFVSIFNFYLGLGQQLSDMSGEEVSTEPRDLLTHFTENFLLAGSLAGGLFWLGVVICIVGLVRLMVFGRKRPALR